MTNNNSVGSYNNIMEIMRYDKNTDDILNDLITLKNKITDKNNFMTKLNGDYIIERNIINNKKLKSHANNILKYLQSTPLNNTIKKFNEKIIINSKIRKKYYDNMLKDKSIKLSNYIKSINNIDIYDNLLIFTDTIYHYIIDVDYNNLNNFALVTPLSFMFKINNDFIDCFTLSLYDDRYKNNKGITVSVFKININTKHIYTSDYNTNKFNYDYSFIDKCLIPEIYMILHTLDKMSNRKIKLKKSPIKKSKTINHKNKAQSYNSWKKEYLEEKPRYIDSEKTDITREYKHSFEVSKHYRTYRYCKACDGFIKKADRNKMKCPRCQDYLKIKIKKVEIDSYVKNEGLPRKESNIIIDSKEEDINNE